MLSAAGPLASFKQLFKIFFAERIRNWEFLILTFVLLSVFLLTSVGLSYLTRVSVGTIILIFATLSPLFAVAWETLT